MLILSDLPKAELHVHLEGSVEAATLQELEPTLSIEEIAQRYVYSDFSGFIECFKWVNSLLRSPTHYAHIARRLVEKLESQNVRYAEITLSAGVILWKKQDFSAIYEAVREAASKSSVKVYWILDAVRQFGAEHAMEVAKLAAGRVEDGVVAFGIGGDEQAGPAENFTTAFEFARDNGLHAVAHAGETGGTESMWAAIKAGAERIGHGICALDDPYLVRHLHESQIPLEICISSNVATRVVPTIKDHPIRRLYNAGIPIVLNTDDPAMFHTSLTQEYELVREVFGFFEEDLRQIAANGFRFGFMADEGQ